MGRFATETDLLLHGSLRDSFKYCHLIGENTDDESLKLYTEQLTKKYIVEQVQYFPNSQRAIDFWIIAISDLLYSVIVKDELPITEMSPVSLSTLLSSTEDNIKKFQ